MKKIKTKIEIDTSSRTNNEYKHGIKVVEINTNVNNVSVGNSTVQVVVGTAPFGTINKPILCRNFDDYNTKLGYVAPEHWDNFTLARSAYINYKVFENSNIVFINVLDPDNPAFSEDATMSATLNPDTAITKTLDLGAIIKTIVCKNGTTALVLGTDYTIATDTESNVIITFKKSETTNINITYKKLKPDAVTDAHIIGQNIADNETGLGCIRQVYPALGIVPSIILAPKYSQDKQVAQALTNACKNINGCFEAQCVIDLESTRANNYSLVADAKKELGIEDKNAIICWGKGKINNMIFYLSETYGALIQNIDRKNEYIPYLGASNQNIQLSGFINNAGEELLLDEPQANIVNASGVCTVKRQGSNFVFWGNNTSAYPQSTNINERWIMVRRMFSWWKNNFCISYKNKIDNPMNRRLIESVIDAENIKINSYIARKIIAGGEIRYLDNENSTEDLMNGKIKFHIKFSPFIPAEYIEAQFEYDLSALNTALGGNNE